MPTVHLPSCASWQCARHRRRLQRLEDHPTLHSDGVKFDRVMLANSFTILTHPAEVMDFMVTLHAEGITIINSAVFNAGFLLRQIFRLRSGDTR